MRFPVKILATAVVAGSAWSMAGSAGAVPLAASRSFRDASTPLVQTVQWRRWGWGVGAGVVAGAIVGSAIARNSYYYGGYPAYSYGYGGYPAYSYGYSSPAYSYGYASYGGYGPAYSGYAYAPGVYRRYWRRW
jgi:hypothetical protein